MNLLPILLVLAAASPEGTLSAPPLKDDVLVYEGPAEAATDPSAYAFTTYAPGDKPFLSVDEANLRGSASIDAPVVRTLRLGSQVEVLELVSEATFVKDRVDRWYRVRTAEAEPKEGFVLGNVLTPLAATGDLDGDGKEESVAVSFTSDFVIRVRVLEPELAARGKRAVAALDFLMPEEQGKRGGRARLVKVSSAEMGVTVSPRAFGLSLCGDSCVVHAVTYDAKKGVLGSLSVPPEVRGDLRLLPRPTRLVSLRIEGEDRDPEQDVPCSVIAKVHGGPHDKKEVLSCVVTWGGKGDSGSQGAIYYLRDAGKQLRRTGGEDWWDLDGKLKRKGYRVVVDPDTQISGLNPPLMLYADARGKIRGGGAPHREIRALRRGGGVHPPHARYGDDDAVGSGGTEDGFSDRLE